MMLAAIFLPLQIPNIAPNSDKAWIYAVEIKSHGMDIVLHDRFEIQLRVEASGDATWPIAVSAKRPSNFTYSGLVEAPRSVMFIEQDGFLSSVLLDMESRELTKWAMPLPDSGISLLTLYGRTTGIQVLSSTLVQLSNHRRRTWWSARIDNDQFHCVVTVDRLLDREFMPVFADVCIWTTQDSYFSIKMIRKSVATDKRQSRTKQPRRSTA